jgi:Phosphodiester glycosidase
MKFLYYLLLALGLTACLPAKPFPKKVVERAIPVAPPPAPAAPIVPAQVTTQEIAGITFEGVAFDSRSHHLAVADQPGGPGSLYQDSEAATAALHGLAAVNAGYFTPEGDPLGLVVSSGKISGAWNSTSSLGSAAWYQTRAGISCIARREKLGRPAAIAMQELLQAGPLLVENGKPIGGLEATKTSARIALLWDGGTRWWIGRSSPCALAEISKTLATQSPTGWPIRHALNLDGGRSADLFISSSIPGGPLTNRPIWNKPVRNFLVLLKN